MGQEQRGNNMPVTTAPSQNSMLMQLLLAYLQQQQQQQQQPQPAATSTGEKLVNKGIDVYKNKEALSSFFGSGSAPAATEAANTAWNAGADAATQAAWNAGADQATLAAGQPLGTLASEPTSVLAGAAPYLGAAGAGLGAYGVYNATQMNNKRKAGLTGGLSGAGMGLGMGMAAPLVGLGPLGWGALGLMALGGGALGGGLGAGLAHKTTKQKQAERWGDLLDKNYTGVSDWYNAMQNNPQPSGDVNTQFEETRDEKFLRPQDIWGSADVINAAGNDYFGKWDFDKRKAFSQALLDQKLVNEKKGGIYVDDEKAKAIAQQMSAGTFPSSSSGQVVEQPPGYNDLVAHFPAGANFNDILGKLSSGFGVAPTTPGTLQGMVGQSVQPQQPDAGTLKRWRELKGTKGYTGR
jgi:hypothetical protein